MKKLELTPEQISFTMSENKISQMPWYLDDTYNQDENISLIGADKKQIGNLFQDGCGNGDKTPGNAKAIISAVNNTYGSGVNPEAVPDLLTALNELMAWAKSIEGNEVSHGITNTPDSIFSFSREAIDKAKLI
jgi:hypothetical protein